MRRLFLALTLVVLTASLAYATVNVIRIAFYDPGWTIPGADPAGGCTSPNVLTAFFENDDDVTVGGGCTALGDSTWTVSGATYSSVQASQGTYSLLLDNNTENAVISVNDAVFNEEAGTFKFDYYHTAVGGGAGQLLELMSDTGTQYQIRVRVVDTDELTLGFINFNGGGDKVITTTDCDMPTDDFTAITASWRLGSDGTENLYIDCGGTPVTYDLEISTWGTYADADHITIGNSGGWSAFGYVDNLRAYNVWYEDIPAGITLESSAYETVGTGLQMGTTITLEDFEVTAGDDRLLVVNVQTWTSFGLTEVTGITFNGDSSTALGAEFSTDDESALMTYYLVAPDVGTYDVIVSLDGTPTEAFIFVEYFTGVDQITPVDGYQGASSIAGSSGTASYTTSVVSEEGDMVVDCLNVWENFVVTPVAGQTEVVNTAYDSDYPRVAGSYKDGATSVDIDWTWSGAEWFQHSAFNINAASPSFTYYYGGDVVTSDDTEGGFGATQGCGASITVPVSGTITEICTRQESAIVGGNLKLALYTGATTSKDQVEEFDLAFSANDDWICGTLTTAEEVTANDTVEGIYKRDTGSFQHAYEADGSGGYWSNTWSYSGGLPDPLDTTAERSDTCAIRIKVVGDGNPASTCTTEFADTFDGTGAMTGYNGWTVAGGTATRVSGVVDLAASTAIVNSASLSSADIQWARADIVYNNGVSLYLRIDTSAYTELYVASCWSTALGWYAGAGSAEVAVTSSAGGCTNGQALGGMVDGTGNDARMHYWTDPINPAPFSAGSACTNTALPCWDDADDAPTLTFTDDPGANIADTSTGIGFGGGGAAREVDNYTIGTCVD